MDDKKANLIAALSIFTFITVIIIARTTLGFSKSFYLFLGANIAAIISAIVIVLVRNRFNGRRRLLEKQMNSQGCELRTEYSFLRKVAGVPTKFTHKELEDSTDGFRSLIGRGSSGSVFKGILNNGTAVAVKRIEGQERGEREFRSEVAAIASVQHVNLVRLIGYCSVSTGPRFLVYEFIPNGSLDKWIFPRRGTRGQPSGCLSWDLRCRVAVDVAKALSYLQHDCRSKILHLDVKPENILLDENYHGLVGDFGLSKLMGRDESRVMTTMRGTRGYIAPEWLLEQGISEKCDIYSFGMVLLEIVGGRRNVSVIDNGNDRSKRKFQFFPKIVRDKLREGTIMEVVDDRLLDKEQIDAREVKRLVCVGLWCIQENPKARPSMAEVVDMLEGRVQVDEPPATQMIVVDLLAVDQEEENSGNHGVPIMEATRLDSNSLPSSGYSYAMTLPSPR